MPSLKVWTVLILYVVSTYFRRSITAQGYGFHSQRSSDLNDHHGHEHDHHLSGRHHHHDDVKDRVTKLPEALPEEEYLKSIGFSAGHNIDHNLNEGPIPGFGFLKDGIVVMHMMVVLVLISTSYEGLWVRAMGCSLVNMSSLIRLILLPVFFLQGKTSKMMVDSLSLFGDEAILRDAFLHQFPHALGRLSLKVSLFPSGSHGSSHTHSLEHAHDHLHSREDTDGHDMLIMLLISCLGYQFYVGKILDEFYLPNILLAKKQVPLFLA